MSLPSLSVLVHQMRLEAPHIVSLELRPLPGGPALPAATAGAHIDLQLAPGLVRSYSLVYPGQAGAYTVAVLKDRASRGGSRQVHEQLRVGQTLQIGAPRNHFALHEDAPRSVLIAGGIGITPIYAMLQRLAELGRPAHLIYAARSAREAAYVAEIEALLARSPQLSVHWHWDDVQGGPPDLQALLAGTRADTHLYACGPAPLLQAYEQACAQLGLSLVHLERFAALAPAPSAAGAAAQGCTVELRKSGKTVQVPADANLLDTLLAAGCAMSYSCHEGVCGACETRVLEGEVEHLDSILTADEQRANKSLMPCVSRPRSARLVLDA